MRILITGISGFVGGHLAGRLLEAGHALAGFGRNETWPDELASIQSEIEYRQLELSDITGIAEFAKAFRPDGVFHLAGYANTGRSFKEPDVCWEVNVDGTRNLFRALDLGGQKPRVIFASTGLIYGEPDPGQDRLSETTQLKPASPYAASKAAGDLLCYQLGRSAGWDIIRVRLFNQIGPRQTPDFALASFARQIAAIERGDQPPILETGDLSAYRDLTDVRDVTTALAALMEKGEKGEAYNIGSGRVWRIADALQEMLKLAKVPIEVRTKVEPGRAADTTVSFADTGKLERATGWKPKYTLKETLESILDYWRNTGERS